MFGESVPRASGEFRAIDGIGENAEERCVQFSLVIR